MQETEAAVTKKTAKKGSLKDRISDIGLPVRLADSSDKTVLLGFLRRLIFLEDTAGREGHCAGNQHNDD